MSISKRSSKAIGDSILNGRYKIRKVLHTGGMSSVYEVTDSQLGTIWCLKEIDKSNAGRNKIEYRSLLKEARIMRGLNHPSIPRIVTIEEEDNYIFIVMDYVQGKSIKDILDSKKVLSQSQAVSIMSQVAKVLMYLHSLSNPILYRDMKPSNIMLLKDGTIRLIDFGISEEITEDNKVIKEALGTWGFAAPEQVKKGAEYDLRSDIFSFGRTFYTMITGVAPPRDLKQSLKPIRSINSTISVGLESFINKCMALNPDERYQDFSTILVDLPNVDKHDGGYRVKQYLKLIISSSLLITALTFGSLGVIGKRNEVKNLQNKYLNALELARSSNNINDWVTAIEKSPLKIEPYFEMLEQVKQDGVFSDDEEKAVLGVITPNSKQLSSSPKYKDLTLELGKIYYFYRNGDVKAGKWLYDSKDTNELANILFNLTEFNKNLKSAVLESSDSGLYEEYFKNLVRAMETDGGELLKLASESAFVDCVSFYSSKLKRDGVSKDKILVQLDKVKEDIKGINPETSSAKGYLENIKNKLESAYRAVEVSYDR